MDRAGNYQSWIHGQDTNRYKRNTAGDAVYVRGLRFAGVAPAPAA